MSEKDIQAVGWGMIFFLLGIILFWFTRTPNPPPHKPETHRCHVVRLFTSIYGGYKSSSSERPHMVVYDHVRHENDDIEISWDRMANVSVGDTLLVEYCDYCRCWEHEHYKEPCKDP